MLELKGIEVKDANVLPGMQRIQLRLLGFRGGTVPALKLDGRKVQGSVQIARILEEVQPEPSLFPADPELRRRADEAERWGNELLQDVPRRIFRWGLVRHLDLREWLAARSGMPAPALTARLSGLNARYYARIASADEQAVRRDLESLTSLLDHADQLLAEGVLSTDPANAAALQVLSSVRALHSFTDLHPAVSQHASAAEAAKLFPDQPGPIPPFLPPEWLAGLN
jgi:glutathione S-transferase